jgi:hypothetical protein
MSNMCHTSAENPGMQSHHMYAVPDALLQFMLGFLVSTQSIRTFQPRGEKLLSETMGGGGRAVVRREVYSFILVYMLSVK